MKYTLSFCLLFFILSCKTEPKLESITITKNEVNEMVTFLASDELQGRHAGSEGIEKAASYIENQFKAYILKLIEINLKLIV